MGNTIKTLTAGDITREALSILHNKLVFIRTIGRQYDDRFAKSGAKNGGYLEIRKPNQFTVRTGAVMDTQDVTEETTQLVLATQKGVDVNFSSAELTLSMDDFKKRILEPAMARLSAEVEKTVINACYADCWLVQNTTHGTKPVLADILGSRAILQQNLAPEGDRYSLVDALAANSIITDGKSLFHAASEIERQYKKGILGEISGVMFNESEMTPRHTNGSRTTAGTCNLGAVVNGDTHLTCTHTNAETFAVGDVFTVAGVYRVNPETKVNTGILQQFVVTAAHTGTGGAADISVLPAIYKSGAKQNMYCADWTAAAAATVVDEATAANSTTGNASTTYTNNLVYSSEAFTFVSADLEMPKGVDFAYRSVYDGISLRLVRQYDITNDKFPCRIDVLFGQKAIRPEWAVRMLS